MSEQREFNPVDAKDVDVDAVWDQVPARVPVIDRRNGEEIGYVDKTDVKEKLKNQRFWSLVLESSNKFVLVYNTLYDSKTFEHTAGSVSELLAITRANIKTALGADDPYNRMLGVSYTNEGRNHHVNLHITTLKKDLWMLPEKLKEKLCAKSDDVMGNGPSEKIVNFVREQILQEQNAK